MTKHVPLERQALCPWPYQVEYLGLRKHSLAEVGAMALAAGLGYLDLLAPEELSEVPTGLKVASLVRLDFDNKGHPPFQVGPNNKNNHALHDKVVRGLIDAAADSNGLCERVTVFFGDERVDPFGTGDSAIIDLAEGVSNCIDAYKPLAKYAEQKKVTLVMELLNDHDRGHPMKGHPHYQGNRLHQCLQVIDGVGSPRLKLLADAYHLALMEPKKTPAEWVLELGPDYVGHLHTAGLADRHETHKDDQIDQDAWGQACAKLDCPSSHEYLPQIHEDPQAEVCKAGRLLAGIR